MPVTLKERRGLYVQYVHGLVFKLVGLTFACAPRACEVIVDGYTQRAHLTGKSHYDAHVLSVWVKREEWERIPFDALPVVNPVQELERFDLRRNLDRSWNLHAITPHMKPTTDKRPSAEADV